ncbi:uncharacterized protein LOC125185239 isoform X3 [Salvia hispanica]|uniref:uncharacterized protein LOC125185239 isoform X3 n=1 Tax=Salvia hispanica TaxID=49212 RepID=UPI002009CA79|nr:uncharacterized protein LOC125185239 isoform X3 [Salvia hispanica]
MPTAMAVAVAVSPPFLGRTLRKTFSGRRIPNSDVRFSIKAIFWGPKKAVEPTKQELSLGDFSLSELGAEGDTSSFDKDRKLSVRVVSSISEILPHEWDACSVDAAGPDKFNPFLTHGFLSSLEETGCAVKYQVSSLHITFPSADEAGKLKEKGFLQRVGMQYHWKNHNYRSFDDFLMDMKQSKRKTIRQERKKISAQNLTMKRLRGYEIKAKHWDTFYKFYRNTTDNKWGSAYLTRDFFHEMASKLGDGVLLVTAEEGDELVAGALNLIGGDTIYGRLWGCLPHAYYPNLHFEACYYQAIEAAIELNLDKVEAGAQGEHKIQRGYMPVATYSCHYILDEDFRKSISNFLIREQAQLEYVMKVLRESGPFKDNAT